MDDNFIGNKKNVKQLLPALAEWNNRHRRPFTFFTEASMNLADDPELLALMKAAGFIRVFLGIETPVEASLKEANKLQNTQRSLLDSVRCIQQHGIEVMAGFIVGFDSDPDDVFDRQVEFIQESAIPIAMVGLLQALPGTQLYRRLEREGRLLGAANGNNIDCNLSFIPTMSAQRLLDGYRSILKRIYCPGGLLRPGPAFSGALSANPYAPLPLGVPCIVPLRREARNSRQRTRQLLEVFLDAATRYRHAFGTAVTLAILGYHFNAVTEEACQTD